MNVTTVLKYTVRVFSAGVMMIGILVIGGFLVPRNVPEQFRFLLGVVIFLYGLYRFVVSYNRPAGRR